MTTRRRGILPAMVLALATTLVLPFYGVARADLAPGPSVATNGGPLTNPLVLSNPTTGAQVQIMPTTAWLAQHTTTGTSSTSSTPSGALSSPACTLATDSSQGDAHALVNNTQTQNDALDISAFGLSSNASTLTGQIAVNSLNNGAPVGGTPAPSVPAVSGGADIWYLVWNYGNDPAIKGYFLEAQYPGDPARAGYVNDASTSGLPVNFAWGTIVTSATGGSQFTSGGAATGTFDTTNNRISIAAPLSSLGNAPVGSTLSGSKAEGDALVGTPASGGLLETADSLNSTSTDYHVGQAGTNCPSSKTVKVSPGLPTAGNSNNLSYYGGPVVHAIKNYLIWWLPQAGTTTHSDGTPCTAPATTTYSYERPLSNVLAQGALPGGPDGDLDYKSIITQYFQDLGSTAFYNLLTQYADTGVGATRNVQSLGGQWSDSCGYTSTTSADVGPTPGGTEAAPIYQQDIQREVQTAIAANHWPTGLGNQYYVYTGYGAADCFAPPGPGGLKPTCSVVGPNPVYCAYHGDFQDASGNYVLYANMADAAFAANPSAVNMCYTNPIGVNDPTHSVNGANVTDPIADAEVSITSHEQFETVTDAEVGTAQQYAPPLAWYEAVNGEIGDKCAYNFGNYATDGSNVVLHGNHYIVQQEFSNWNNGCGISSYAGNGGYGGDVASTTIQQGTNLISVPVQGITDTQQLANSLMGPGQLPAGSITQIQLYRNGTTVTYVPGKGKPLPLSRNDGVQVTSTAAGTWTPSGTPYSTAQTINLQPGWNLVAATWPNPGLMTDAIYNQIAAETGACTATILTNGACNPTIDEIKTIGAAGATIDWKPSSPDANGNATWPQTFGNQIPFTSGMWIHSTKAISWTVQGSQCNTVDAAGVCH